MDTTDLREIIFGYGHENIRATHKTTLEFTKDKNLTRNGDCIIAVAADKGLADLSREFKENLRVPNAKLTILIEAGGITEQIQAYGFQAISSHSSYRCSHKKKQLPMRQNAGYPRKQSRGGSIQRTCEKAH